MIFGGALARMLSPTVAKPVAVPLDKLDAAITAVAPHLEPFEVHNWTAALIAPMRSSGITTARRIAAFLGQVAHESAGFTVLSENLNYSAERLCQVWPSRFNASLAVKCAHNPEMIANIVYGMRLGDTQDGDGYRFRGAGLIQLTGRSNQTRFATDAKLKIGDIGEYLRTPKGAAESACWFWTLADHRPSLNTQADLWDIASITRQINGGDNGAAERYSLSAAALTALTGATS